jgi:acetyl-CoA C-acetyltransferase
MSNTPQADPVVIVAASRTPIGGLLGTLASVAAPDLGAAAIRGALAASGIAASDIDETIMGCVLAAGLGQAPARQASRAAGIPDAAGATTINKMCGSGMKAVMFAHDTLLAGSAQVMIAGGMESMSNAPYLLKGSRSGFRYGHDRIFDHMALDGLEDAYEPGRAMGSFAEATAAKFGLSREAQDAYAISSVTRARAAIASGAFKQQITPIMIQGRKGETLIEHDEQPAKAKLEKVPNLRPAFAEGGTVTAASSSSISDGAAALILMRRSQAVERGLRPLARIVGHAGAAAAPEWFSTAPIAAIDQLMAKIGWQQDQVDLYEINEAFAVVPLVAIQQLGIDAEKVNVNGGACALGHPIGASGARILVTLLAALADAGLETGVASLCIGGGEATAMAIALES